MRISRATLAADARSLALLTLVLGAAFLCSATNITYHVNQTIGAGGVTGNIVTDGTIGILGGLNIVDWNLLLNDGTNTVDLLGPLSGSNSVVFLEYFTAPSLSATATQLLFNFSTSNSLGAPDYLLFEGAFSPTDGYVCFVSPSCTTNTPLPPLGSGEEQVSATSGLGNWQYTILTGTQVIGTAGPSVPEPSALTLLGTGIGLLGLRLKIHREKRSIVAKR